MSNAVRKEMCRSVTGGALKARQGYELNGVSFAVPARGGENLPCVSVSIEVKGFKILRAIRPLGAHHSISERRKQPLGAVVTPDIPESDDRNETGVACHPSEEVVAIGYKDGSIIAARFADGDEARLRKVEGGPISALAWDAAGIRLAFGTEDGTAGIVDLAG